jgi:hypothetical protein
LQQHQEKELEKAKSNQKTYELSDFMSAVEKNMPEKIINHPIWATIKEVLEKSITEVI